MSRPQWELDENGLPVRVTRGSSKTKERDGWDKFWNGSPASQRPQVGLDASGMPVSRGRKGSLSTLRRGDDIPKHLYSPGVPTGVGGGNAAQSQSTNPDGDAYIPPTPAPALTVPTRETKPPTPGADRNAKGTQMGSRGALADFDAFAARLTDEYGVGFQFDSDQLPTNPNHQRTIDAPSYNRDAADLPDYVEYNGEIELLSGLYGKDGNGGWLGQAEYGDLAEKADASRAIDFGLDPEATPKYWGTEEKIENPPKGTVAREGDKKKGGPSGINWMDGKAGQKAQRNRAFLDYDGKGGSMMALRAQEAAQGNIRQNGNTYGKNAEGKWVRLSDEAAQELKRDRTLHAGSSYVTDNAYTSKPAEEHAQETLSKHLSVNKEKLSHGEYLDLTNDGPLAPEDNEVTFKNGKTFTMAELNEDEDLWKNNYE